MEVLFLLQEFSLISPQFVLLLRSITGDSPQKQDILSTYSGELHHLAVLDFLRDEHEVVHELIEIDNVDAADDFVSSAYASVLLFSGKDAQDERSAAKVSASPKLHFYIRV